MLFRTAGCWTQIAALTSFLPSSTSTFQGCVEESQPGRGGSRKPKANIFHPEKSGPGPPPDQRWWCALPKGQCFWSPGDVSGGAAQDPPRPWERDVCSRPSIQATPGNGSSFPSRGGGGEVQSTRWPQLFIWQGSPRPEASLEMETPFHIKIGAVRCLGNAKLPGPA